MSAWHPTASRQTLVRRAELLATVRQFFADRHVLEVDTPMLVNAPVTDVHIHSAEVHLQGASRPYFLHTSPEYAMKRLLAAGSGDIYQICHVVRGLERGKLHNAEFTLIEWYRLGFSLEQLMTEVAALACKVLGEHEVEYITYQDAFRRELKIDPLDATDAELRDVARHSAIDATDAEPHDVARHSAIDATDAEPHDVASHSAIDTTDAKLHDVARHSAIDATNAELHDVAPNSAIDAPVLRDLDRDQLLDALMGLIIGPRLGQKKLTFIHRYPASQAALAQLDPHDPRTALRFELYCEGIELANGFHELASATEQRTRFETDRNLRKQRGLPIYDLDENLLSALAHGLPDCSGVALGFDRLAMLATGAKQIDAVLPFPIENA
jgi:lysyl-tRNA synthetase class 2